MKYHLIAVIAMLITGSVTAQNMNLGIKGGVNLYNIHNENDAEYDMKIGFHVGLLSHIHLTDQFAMQPEILYSTQGAKSSVAGSDAELNLGYVNIPLLFQYMFDNGFRIEAGPQLGFLMNAKAKVGSADEDVKDSFKSTDVGVALGLSYVNPGSGFGFDARYNIGLTDINEDSSFKSTNRGFQLGVFYLFDHAD